MGILFSFGRSFSRSVEVPPDAAEMPSEGLSVVLAKFISKSINTMPMMIISLLKGIFFSELTGGRKLGYPSEVLN